MASNNNNASANAPCLNIHMNFNPSWMPQTIPKPVIPANQPKAQADVEETQTCEPIFSKHSYGREDLLAMMEKLKMEAPIGLEKCPFFTKTPHTPMVLLPFTEIEMRLQQNINSSKAMSAFNRTQVHSNNDVISVENSAGAAWNAANAGQNRQGLGTNGSQRKYHPQENKQSTNRWSGLASTGNVAAPRPMWKSSSNAGITGNIERSNMREKSGLINQERNDNVKKQQNIQQENEIIHAASKNESNIPDVSKEPVKYENNKHGTSITPPISDRDLNALSLTQSNMTSSEIVEPQQYLQKWSYLDPNGVQRGPFDSQQMQAWFTNGYFTSSLQVRQVGDINYVSLGELFLMNGEDTPFISKKEQNIKKSSKDTTTNCSQSQKLTFEGSDMMTSKSTIGHIQQRISSSVLLGTSKSGNKLGLDVERIWAATPMEDVGIVSGSFGANSNTQDSISVTGFAHTAFSQHLKEVELEKILQTREVQILEEQRKLRDKEELFQRDEKERLEKERIMQQMEIELKRKQEEFDRIAREKDNEFEKRCIQMAEYERKKREELVALEQRIITEQQRQQLRMEEEDRRRAKELQEILLREQERQRHLIETEMKRKQDEEEARMRLSMQEAQHMKELALEQAKKAQEEQRRRFIDEQQKQQQKALDEARAERKKQQEIATKAEAIAKAEQERITKWQTIVPQENAQTPTMFSNQCIIQPSKKLQPSLQMQQEQRSAWQTIPDSGKPLQMNVTQQLPVPDKQNVIHQQYAATERERRGWQQVSTPKPAPIPPAIAKNIVTNVSGKQHNVQTKQQQKGAKGKTKQLQANVEDKLTEWICNKLKELNSSVDAEVFANFLAQIDSPNEAEDYIIGYLGDRKEVKDFYKEFLIKRIELRPRTHQLQKDDLSRPAAALNADIEPSKGSTSANPRSNTAGLGTSQNSNGGTNANKKKKHKKVLDASNLGFTAISNPNRVNAGEIDRVPPAIPSTNRKR